MTQCQKPPPAVSFFGATYVDDKGFATFLALTNEILYSFLFEIFVLKCTGLLKASREKKAYYFLFFSKICFIYLFICKV